VKKTKLEKFENNDLAIYVDVRRAKLDPNDTYFLKWIANKKLAFKSDPTELVSLKVRALNAQNLANGKGLDTQALGKFKQQYSEALIDGAKMPALQQHIANQMGSILSFTKVDVSDAYFIYLG